MIKQISAIILISVIAFFSGCQSQLAKEKKIVMDILQQAGATGVTFEDVAKVENGRVVSINIPYGKIVKFPNSLAKIVSLRALTLRNCQILEITDSISLLTTLDSLVLTENQLETLPHAFSKLKNLKTLSLSGNNFKKLPVEILEITNLEKLSIGNNLINTIPEDINRLKALKNLVLNGNNLRRLPKNIYTIEKLEYLNLRNNGLFKLDAEIKNLKFLEELDITGNKLTTLPKEIVELENLKKPLESSIVGLKIDENEICVDKVPKKIRDYLILFSGERWNESQNCKN